MDDKKYNGGELKKISFLEDKITGILLLLLRALKLSCKRGLLGVKSLFKSVKLKHSCHVNIFHVHEGRMDLSRNVDDKFVQKVGEELHGDGLGAVLHKTAEDLVRELGKIALDGQCRKAELRKRHKKISVAFLLELLNADRSPLDEDVHHTSLEIGVLEQVREQRHAKTLAVLRSEKSIGGGNEGLAVDATSVKDGICNISNEVHRLGGGVTETANERSKDDASLTLSVLTCLGCRTTLGINRGHGLALHGTGDACLEHLQDANKLCTAIESGLAISDFFGL